MNGRRALSELLSELADSAVAFVDVAAAMPVRARSLSVSVPVDLRLTATDDGAEVIADVPLFLTRTDFDTDPARLEVAWQVVRVPVQEAS
jgi:hypothetical protein